MNSRIFLVACIALTPWLSMAEDGTRGRLADGRAYRTDPEGNQLVDYIAELEVNVEALNRRILGLEDEIAEKQRIIERFHGGATGAAAYTGTLKEKALVDGVASQENALSGDSPEHVAEVAKVRAEMESLRVQLDGARGELATERRLRDQDQATYAVVSRECASLRTSPKPSCDAAVALALQSASQQALARETELQGELARIRTEGATELANVRTNSVAELRSAQDRARDLEREVTELKRELGGMRTTMAATAARPATIVVSPQSAAINPAPTHAVVAAARPVTRDYATRSRLAVVDSLRGNMSAELNRVRGLVSSRDDLFRRSTGQGDPRIQFKPSPLLSSSRKTLDDIGAGIRAAQQVHELTALRTDLAEIRALVQGDIDLLRRTGKAG
jgi:hypothetical protein